MVIFQNIVLTFNSENFIFFIEEYIPYLDFEISIYNRSFALVNKMKINFWPNVFRQIDPQTFLIGDKKNGAPYLLKVTTQEAINIIKISDNLQIDILDDPIENDNVIFSTPQWPINDMHYFSLSTMKDVWYKKGLSGIIKFQNIFNINTEDKILTLINKDNGDIKWQFDFTEFVKEKYRKIRFIFFQLEALINNELICIANEERILSININTGKLLWCIEETWHSETQSFEHIRGYRGGAVYQKAIYTLQGYYYSFLDVENKKLSILKDFSTEAGEKKLWFHKHILYEDKLFFITDIGFENWKYNRIGCFDIASRKVLWQRVIDLPPLFMLNQLTVDDQRIYVIAKEMVTNKTTLYILEKGLDY